MDITFLGKNAIKINGRDLAIAIDAKPTLKADVYLFSTPQDASVDGLMFDGPGEYEVKGAMIDGVALEQGNTAYSLLVDDVRVAHLGALAQDTLSDVQLEGLEAVDVLFVPLDGRKAEITSKLVSQLEPRIVVPIDWDKDSLAAFLSETGAAGEKMDKLKLQRKDLLGDTQQVVVLETKN